jgi:hypothetical protein
MCIFSSPSPAPAPTQPTVDPAAERLKSEAEAATKANEQLLSDARRKRQQKGVLATGADTTGSSVLATAGKDATAASSTVLGSAAP